MSFAVRSAYVQYYSCCEDSLGFNMGKSNFHTMYLLQEVANGNVILDIEGIVPGRHHAETSQGSGAALVIDMP